MGESRLVQVFQRRAQILKKKIDASREETSIFAEELAEIEEQLQVSLRHSELLIIEYSIMIVLSFVDTV